MLEQPERYNLLGFRHLPLAVPIGLALAILAGTIFYAGQYLRQNSREQITNQHAQILYALWLREKSEEQTDDFLAIPEVPADQILSVLALTRLPQMLANLLDTRVFDERGDLVFKNVPNVSDTRLPPDYLAQLQKLQPIARFRGSANLGEVSVAVALGAPSSGPLLDVFVPLHPVGSEQFVGVAQFILDGAAVAAEFRKLDRHLMLQGSLTFLVGGGLLAVVLGLSFRQLERMNRLLSERTSGLLRANQELALAAKTSAVGAVTAHLIHGLKNPLSGLQSFVASRVAGGEQDDGDWQMAVSSTRRMQTMIGEIVRVLRDEETAAQYELSLQELAGMVCSKIRPLAQDAGVKFEYTVSGDGILRNREANLISLILYNLAQNAIQATPRDKSVTLTFQEHDEVIACHVRDQGPGFTETQRADLFKPCRSNKEGGSGIGLAISHQLAKYIGAELELKETSEGGSLFVLSYSRAAELASTDLAARDQAS